MAAKLGRILTYLERFPSMLPNPLVMCSCKITWQTITIISPITVSMATMLGRMLTYLELLPTIRLLDPLVTCSCKITWLTKPIISSLPQCLWPPNLLGWRLRLRGSYHTVTWLLIWSLIRSHDSLKNLYLHFHFHRLTATKLGLVTWQRGGSLARKRINRHRLLA